MNEDTKYNWARISIVLAAVVAVACIALLLSSSNAEGALITDVTVIPGDDTAGATGVTYAFQFNTTTAVAADGLVNVPLPAGFTFQPAGTPTANWDGSTNIAIFGNTLQYQRQNDGPGAKQPEAAVQFKISTADD